MIQMKLFAKQKSRHRRREWTYGSRGEGGRWDDLGD